MSNKLQEMLNVAKTEMPKGVDIFPVILDASLAKLLLDNNYHGQRKLKKTIIDKYASDMTKGDWMFNGETICIDENGFLIQGQHRCSAVVKSNAEVKVLIVNGIKTQAYHTMDQGNKRNYADILTSSGNRHASLLAPLVNTSYRHSVMGSIAGGSAGKNYIQPTISSLNEHYNRDSVHFDKTAAFISKKSKKIKALGPRRIICYFYHLASKIDNHIATQIIEEMTDFPIDKDSPIAVLFRQIKKINDNNIKVTSCNIMSIYSGCFNSMRNGLIKRVKPFPVLDKDGFTIFPEA